MLRQDDGVLMEKTSSVQRFVGLRHETLGAQLRSAMTIRKYIGMDTFALEHLWSETLVISHRNCNQINMIRYR